MNQWYAKKRHVFVLLTLVGAILMGLVWLAGSPGSASAQDMLTSLSQAASLTSTLTGEKSASADVIYDGGTINFQIVLRNSDTVPIYDVQVRDILNPRLEVVSASAGTMGSVVTTTSGATYTVWLVPPSGSVTLDLRARVRQGSFLLGTVITNAATISDSVNVFVTNPVTFTMAEYLAPTSQIDAPWPQQRFAQRGTFSIRGRVWIGDRPVNFPVEPTLNPINNFGVGSYTVAWTSDIPGDVLFELQESTRADFATIRNTWSNLSVKLRAIINPVGVYYYRVRAVTTLGDSRWSAARQVTVTTPGYAQADALTLFESSLPQLSVTQMPSQLAAMQSPTVTLVISGPTTSQQYAATVVPDPLGGNWWQWVYTWTLPQQNNVGYTIESRAYNQGYYDAALNDRVTVLVDNGTRYIYLPVIAKRYPPIPYGTTLNIASDDGYGTYQLSWVYNFPGDSYAPTSYLLQEATNASFTSPTESPFPATTLSHSYTNKAVGTYYYRVRGKNTFGDGPWSNVQTIVVRPRGFYDDFSNVNSGWPRQVYSIDGRQVLDASYDNGTYRMKIMLDTSGLNNKRMGIIPAPYAHTDNTYDVEVQHRFVKALDQTLEPTAGKAGIIFYGQRTSEGTGYFETAYIVEWNFEGHCSISRYINYSNVLGHHPYVPVAWLGRDPILREWGSCPGLQAGYDKLIVARVEMRGSYINVFFNNNYVGTYSATFSGSSHVGLVTGSWERTPMQSRFDEFRVTDR